MRFLVHALAIAVLLALAPSAQADQLDPRLKDLFAQLKQVRSHEKGQHITDEIWAVWHESGRDEIDRLMEEGRRSLNGHDYITALHAFDQVVEKAPDYAEGWNKRATVHFLLNNFEQSIADVERTLALEPRHFGALAGLGLIFMEYGQKRAALRAFEQAVRFNPHLSRTKDDIKRLRRILGEKAI